MKCNDNIKNCRLFNHISSPSIPSPLPLHVLLSLSVVAAALSVSLLPLKLRCIQTNKLRYFCDGTEIGQRSGGIGMELQCTLCTFAMAE